MDKNSYREDAKLVNLSEQKLNLSILSRSKAQTSEISSHFDSCTWKNQKICKPTMHSNITLEKLKHHIKLHDLKYNHTIHLILRKDLICFGLSQLEMECMHLIILEYVSCNYLDLAFMHLFFPSLGVYTHKFKKPYSVYPLESYNS